MLYIVNSSFMTGVVHSSFKSAVVKARVYNPVELAREIARFKSGTSSKFHSPFPIPSVLCPKPLPHKLERASVSGTQQGEGDAGARRNNSAEFSKFRHAFSLDI